MVLVDQLVGNVLVFSFVGWAAFRALYGEDKLVEPVLLAVVLAFAAPVFGTSLSAEPFTMVALVLLTVGLAQHVLKASWVETISLVALIWVFGASLLGMTF